MFPHQKVVSRKHDGSRNQQPVAEAHELLPIPFHDRPISIRGEHFVEYAVCAGEQVPRGSDSEFEISEHQKYRERSQQYRRHLPPARLPPLAPEKNQHARQDNRTQEEQTLILCPGSQSRHQTGQPEQTWSMAALFVKAEKHDRSHDKESKRNVCILCRPVLHKEGSTEQHDSAKKTLIASSESREAGNQNPDRAEHEHKGDYTWHSLVFSSQIPPEMRDTGGQQQRVVRVRPGKRCTESVLPVRPAAEQKAGAQIPDRKCVPAHSVRSRQHAHRR